MENIMENNADEAKALRRLKNLVKEGQVFVLAKLLKKEMSESLRKETEKALVKAISVCGRTKLSDEVDLLLREEKLGEEATLAAIRVCEKYKKAFGILCLCNRDDLSERVMNELIRFCESEGRVRSLAHLFEKATKPSMKKRLESALLNGIKVCEEREWFFEVKDLLERKGLGKKVEKAVWRFLRKYSGPELRYILLDNSIKPPSRKPQEIQLLRTCQRLKNFT